MQNLNGEMFWKSANLDQLEGDIKIVLEEIGCGNVKN
jgi:hypothetical protein